MVTNVGKKTDSTKIVWTGPYRKVAEDGTAFELQEDSLSRDARSVRPSPLNSQHCNL